MQIEIKCRCGEDKCQEWAIVELQGVIETQPSFQGSLQNLEIGQLCRPNSQETYTFTVGYHELTGSKVTLKQPLVVLKKKKKRTGFSVEGRSEDGGPPSEVELEVVGIIRQKILFKSRPKALISGAQPVVKEKGRQS